MIKKCDLFLKRIKDVPVRFWLGAILLLGFLIRLLAWHLEPIIVQDAYWYMQTAEYLYKGGAFETIPKEWLSGWLPPLYPFCMKILMQTGFSAETAGVTLNILLGSLTPAIAYGIAWEVTQKKDVTLCTALLIAVHPGMVEMSTVIMRDMSYLTYIGLTLYFLVAGLRRQRSWCWIGCGGAFSLALLTRYESLEIIPILILVLFLLAVTKRISWRKAIKGAAVFSISTVVFFFSLIYSMQCQNYIYTRYNLYLSTKVQTVKQQTFTTE